MPIFSTLASAAVAWKVAGIAGCSGGAFLMYRSMPEPKYRAMLRKAFKTGDMGIKRTVNKVEKWRYPTIKRVALAHDRVQFFFTLPKGLNPDTILNKAYVFVQYFGELSQVTGNAKQMELKVFFKDLEQFNYAFSAVKEKAADCKVPIYVGKGFDGHFVFDMRTKPHMLVSGETGGGKSTGLRSIITTTRLSIPPDQLKMYLSDLKGSEFGMFEPFVHSVSYTPKKLERQLAEIHAEMKKRGREMRKEGVHIQDIYKMKNPPPTIILCIDEVGLIKGQKELFKMIEDIGMAGRALGVFLILSMQRPDAKLLDGRLKQCLTVRASFRQPDELNSRIAIGSKEASLIGTAESQRGRLYVMDRTLEMLQAPHLEAEEVMKLLEPYRKKVEPEDEPEEPSDDNDDVDLQEFRDPSIYFPPEDEEEEDDV